MNIVGGCVPAATPDSLSDPRVIALTWAGPAHTRLAPSRSIPERDAQGRLFNTCLVFDRAGQRIGKHRKVCGFHDSREEWY